ncbi:MAG: MBL fold metallo-hydrolase [Eubacteriales bacterium]|nr:MBL fold metallo-hydrolase [Eubacteriales bacterium]
MPKLKVDTIVVGEVQTNCYVVENTETHEVLVIDPGAEASRIVALIGNRKPVAVLLTHGHFDHMGAVDELCQRYSVPLYVHEADAAKLTDAKGNVSECFGEHLTVKTQPILLVDGQRLTLGGIALEVLHTPGHSEGSCCYLAQGDECVFCGDTLFNGGYGRTDFDDGDFMKLKESLRKLFHLTPKRTAYPGHGDITIAGRGDSL